MNAFESLQLISNDKTIWIEHFRNYGHIFKGLVKTDDLKRYPNRINGEKPNCPYIICLAHWDKRGSLVWIWVSF